MPSTPGEKVPARTRRPRGSLSREEILAGAYELVAQGGLEALSMPNLARRLEAGVTSIYWYFRNKEELLVALAERVTEDVYGALPKLVDGPWTEQLRAYFVEFRAVLHRFPVYVELYSFRPRFVLTRPRIFPLVLSALDEAVGVMTTAGLGPSDAARSIYACSVYTRGYVILELGVLREPDEVAEVTHVQMVTQVEHLDASDFPVLTTLGDLDPIAALGDEHFEAGLDLLLDGIRSELDRTRRSA